MPVLSWAHMSCGVWPSEGHQEDSWSAKGSVIVAVDEVHVIDAHPTQVVDTTGAGDQYAAGFLYGLTHDMPLTTCGRLASKAAAEVISHFGPRPSITLSTLLS